MTRSSKEVLQKMQNLFSQEISRLGSTIIMPTDGGVRAFGVYDVACEPGHVVVRKNNGAIREFSMQSHAMAWCVADKFEQPAMRRRIEYLSDSYHKLQQDLQRYKKRCAKSSEPEVLEILQAKMSQCRYALINIGNQLEKCISQAKYWQQQEFHHEIERSQATNPAATGSHGNGELSGAWARIQ